MREFANEALARDKTADNHKTFVIDMGMRERRKELSLRRQELSKRTSFTASFFSFIDRWRISPALESLRRIADALDVPLYFFWSDPCTRWIIRLGLRVSYGRLP
jgi:transcriptional regulator with XRE-family HTH domain